jgi:long-subunit fatty acid transport protein
MKLRRSTMLVAVVLVAVRGEPPRLAEAGGLMLPGAGAISTARAGAGVASADDGEALVLNPAGIVKAHGTTITVSAAMISYAMEFQRRGTYDAVPGESYPFVGQAYNAVKNDPSPPLGIGSLQPIPVVAVISDLGGAVGGLHLGLGLYAPNSYPFRDMCTQLASGCEPYTFKIDPNGDFSAPPAATRYDIMKQEAAIILPSIVAAYRILPTLDVGLRLSVGQATLKSTTSLWSSVGPNYEEDPKKDGTITVDAKDSFVPAWGLGATFRPTPNIELGASYASELDVHAKGTAVSQLGPSAGVPGLDVRIVPVADDVARCARGGTAEKLKACVDLAVAMNLQIGGRYIFLDEAGKPRGDVELDLDWEHWGKSCSEADILDGKCTSPSDYRVVVDATTAVMLPTGPIPGPGLGDSLVKHGLRDSFGVRLGGSYRIPVGARRDDGDSDQVIVRGGLGYDTAAARTGWLRADLDGAARTTLAVGASYRLRRLEISLGGGVILESPSNPNVGGGNQPCNPTMDMPACRPGNDEHQGPDPINPTAAAQAENPVNQGDYKAHYLLFMLGASTWF